MANRASVNEAAIAFVNILSDCFDDTFRVHHPNKLPFTCPICVHVWTWARSANHYVWRWNYEEEMQVQLVQSVTLTRRFPMIKNTHAINSFCVRASLVGNIDASVIKHWV